MDENDIKKAREFGIEIQKKLKKIEDIESIVKLNVPGKRPYCKLIHIPKMSPVVSKSKCKRCGKCALVCPKGAIDKEDFSKTDKQKCILCCACIKICPMQARKINNIFLIILQKVLYLFCKQRKEPEIYI